MFLRLWQIILVDGRFVVSGAAVVVVEVVAGVVEGCPGWLGLGVAEGRKPETVLMPSPTRIAVSNGHLVPHLPMWSSRSMAHTMAPPKPIVFARSIWEQGEEQVRYNPLDIITIIIIIDNHNFHSTHDGVSRPEN